MRLIIRDGNKPGRWQVWTDVVLPSVVAATLVVTVVILYVFATILNPTPGYQDSDFNLPHCAPNGRAVIDALRYRNQIWDSQQFLSITMGFGRFTYSEAKAIDVAWDLLVGRCGQVGLATVLYGVLRRSMVLLMESRSLSFSTFASVAFERISGQAMWDLACAKTKPCHTPGRKATSWRVRARPAAIMSAYILTCAYVLAFPTITSVMTGYQAQYKAYMRKPNSGDLVDLDQKLDLIKIYSLKGNDPIPGENSTLFRAEDVQTLHDYYTSMSSINDSLPLNISSQDRILPTQCIAETCTFTMQTHGTDKYSIESTIYLAGRNITLPAPPLSLSLELGWRYEGFVRPQSAFLQDDNTTCNPESTYTWGFSSLMLLSFLVLSILFVLMIVALQWDIYEHSRVDPVRQSTSVFRDVLDMASEMRAQLGDAVADMSADELQDKIRKQPGDISVEVHGELKSRHQERKAGSGCWMRANEEETVPLVLRLFPWLRRDID